MIKRRLFYFLFGNFLCSMPVWAYPDFISYGYKSCLNCHFNGLGGGGLTDYGRSLFASEITARTFVDSKKTDDELAEESGFFGKQKIPQWIRPGFKYRGLYLKNNLGTIDASERFIQMQADANFAILLDSKEKYIFVFDYGYIPTPRRLEKSASQNKPTNWYTKEFYFRWNLFKNVWTYFGRMEKAFGIHHPDHSAFNKSYDGFGLNQNDQTDGVLTHYNQKNIDFFVHLFAGNTSQDSDLRQKGLSAMTEYFFNDNLSLGASFLKSSNDYLGWERNAIHSRISYGKGKSLLFEVGTRKDTPKDLVSHSLKTGSYFYLHNLVLIGRGFNFLTNIQVYNDHSTLGGIIHNRLSLGFLLFPWKRTEFRTELINDRTTANANSTPDTWSGLAQVHLSW